MLVIPFMLLGCNENKNTTTPESSSSSPSSAEPSSSSSSSEGEEVISEGEVTVQMNGIVPNEKGQRGYNVTTAFNDNY